MVAIIVTISYSMDVPWEAELNDTATENVTVVTEDNLEDILGIPVLAVLVNQSWPLKGEQPAIYLRVR